MTHRAQYSVDEGVGAAFGHRHEADLTKGLGGLVIAVAANGFVVGRSAGHVEDHTSTAVTEMFIKISDKRQYLWRAVDQDGTVLDILVTSRRDARPLPGASTN